MLKQPRFSTTKLTEVNFHLGCLISILLFDFLLFEAQDFHSPSEIILYRKPVFHSFLLLLLLIIISDLKITMIFQIPVLISSLEFYLQLKSLPRYKTMDFAYILIFFCSSVSVDVLVNLVHVIALILFTLISKFHSLNLQFKI